MKWTKEMPEKAGYYWLRITVNEDIVNDPVVVHIDASPIPEMKLIGNGARYTYREAEEELLEVYKSAEIEFMGPIAPPKDQR